MLVNFFFFFLVFFSEFAIFIVEDTTEYAVDQLSWDILQRVFNLFTEHSLVTYHAVSFS